jgi:hypothetical protein
MSLFDSIKYPIVPEDRTTIYAVPNCIWDVYMNVHRHLSNAQLTEEVETRNILKKVILEWEWPSDDNL